MVDNDRDTRTLLAEYLDAKGFRTLTATNGADMRRIFSGSRTDLVVLNLNLPGKDGVTLCRNLRGQAVYVSSTVIMLTARVEPLYRIIGLEMGADDYLAKPFEPRELFGWSRIWRVCR